jgi:hypothetical protein
MIVIGEAPQLLREFSIATGRASYAWMALAIMADATEVPSSHIGEEDVGAEVHCLSSPL